MTERLTELLARTAPGFASCWVQAAGAATRVVAPGGGVERLPRLEYALLRTFIRHPRQLLSRAELELSTRREGRTHSSVRTIDTYVSRLRWRLNHGGGASLISTVRKLGHSFDVDVVRK